MKDKLRQSLASARNAWRHRGQRRPDFAVEPAAGQESVWDYPRPPALAPDSRRVVVRSGDIVIADTSAAIRLLETASPPTFYVPHGDVDLQRLVVTRGGSLCEWKGRARYFDVHGETGPIRRAAWAYDEPFPEFEDIAGYLSFYPALLTCTVGGERVRAQSGGFYGGWVTDEIVGPFKGEPGTGGW